MSVGILSSEAEEACFSGSSNLGELTEISELPDEEGVSVVIGKPDGYVKIFGAGATARWGNVSRLDVASGLRGIFALDERSELIVSPELGAVSDSGKIFEIDTSALSDN